MTSRQLVFPVHDPCSCQDILDIKPIKSAIKVAALKVSPSIVNVITYDIPDDMILGLGGQPIAFRGDRTYAFPGSGIIIQSEDACDGTYFGTIIAPANLFKRTNDLPPHQITVHVRLSDGMFCEGKLLACDFHYNLAAIKIQSDSPLKPATIMHLSHSNHHLQPHGKFGTKIVIAERRCDGDYGIVISTGVLSARDRSKMPCKELSLIKGCERKCLGGGAVLNHNGEVIGICFSNVSFLPFNLVSRWWDHNENCREYRRPYLGVELANLRRKKQMFDDFRRASPNTVTGVVVAKVEENSPAHRFGIKEGDVIIKWDDVPLRSKLEFFEKVWDNAGQVVELTVVKASDGVESHVNMTIEETPRDKLYKWNLPDWRVYDYFF